MEQQKLKTQDALKPFYSELNELEEQVCVFLKLFYNNFDRQLYFCCCCRSKISCQKYQAQKPVFPRTMSVSSKY